MSVTLPLIHRVRQTNASAPAPAIVMVHGWLGNENVMWAFERALPPNALVVSVRAPFESGEGYGWFLPSASGRGDAGEEESARFEESLSALREFVRRFPGEYPVDPNRIALMGFSQGAAMSYALLLSNPELIAGVAALAGFLPDPARQWAAPNRLVGKRVFIAHGLDDATMPVEAATRARGTMEFCGAEVTYHESKIGHKLSAAGMRALSGWLTSFVLKSSTSLTNLGQNQQ